MKRIEANRIIMGEGYHPEPKPIIEVAKPVAVKKAVKKGKKK